MERNGEVDEGERGSPGGGHATGYIQGEPLEHAAHARGNNRFILNDHSHHDNSKHHFGDVHVTTTNYYTGQTSMYMRLKQAQDLLVANVSHGALHNSAQRGPDAPKCFPETRVAVQEEIRSWIRHGDQNANPKRILWLTGPAGSGKTAIAGSIADACYEEGLLAASFFFSSFAGDPDRCSKGQLISTLVYQLMQHGAIRGYRDEVLAVLESDPLILKRNLNAQAEALLLNPLRKALQLSGTQNWPLLILVDGLDEVGGDVVSEGADRGTRMSKGDTHQEILAVLERISNDPSLPFRIIVASRPEQAITRFFSTLPHSSFRRVFLDAKYHPTSDIELFLRAMLSKIGRDYHLQDDWYTYALPLDWSEYETRDVSLYLAREASEQFIYAATVIRYVQDRAVGKSPIERLRHVLSSQPRQSSSNPFSALDSLYSMILNTSPSPLLSVTWLLSINQLNDNLPSSALWIIKPILESTPGETEALLGNLTSVVRLPTSPGSGPKENSFGFYHKSLLDFLRDRGRSGELYVDASAMDRFVRDCFCRTLRNQGPEAPLPSNYRLDRFSALFCEQLPFYHNSECRCNTDDVEWWCSHIEHNSLIVAHFQWLHAGVSGSHSCPGSNSAKLAVQCHWYHCRCSCEVWREGMMRYCRAKGWRVPRWTELLRDRFKKITYYDPNTTDNPYLRPPPRQ